MYMNIKPLKYIFCHPKSNKTGRIVKHYLRKEEQINLDNLLGICYYGTTERLKQ